MPERPAERPQQQAQIWLLAAITVVIVGWALHVMTVVFVPIVCAIFLALVVAPVDRRVARRTPERFRWLGHVAAMGLILLVLAVFFGSLWLAAERVAGQMPQSVGAMLPPAQSAQSVNGEGRLTPGGGGEPQRPTGAEGPQAAEAGAESAPGTGLGGLISQLADAVTQAGGGLTDSVGQRAYSLATTIIASAGTTLGALVIIFFLTLLMLIEGPRWRAKFTTILGRSAENGGMNSVGRIAEKLRRYLMARAILGLLTGALYVAWLWIFGVDLLIVWGLLAFLLNFIPTLGSLIAGILPVIYAFFTKDFGTAILVGAGILVIEQVLGNYVDPRVQGRQVAISPVVVLIVLIVWGWIWGIAGAILAVPMTIALVIVFAHFEPLRPFALLLSRERDMQGLERVAGGD